MEIRTHDLVWKKVRRSDEVPYDFSSPALNKTLYCVGLAGSSSGARKSKEVFQTVSPSTRILQDTGSPPTPVLINHEYVRSSSPELMPDPDLTNSPRDELVS